MELKLTTMIGQQSNEALGAILKRLIDLGGMNPPTEPKSTVEYIKKTYSRYKVELLDDAVEWFLQGNYDPKTRQLTAVLVIKLIKEFLKATPNRSHYYDKPKTSYAFQPTQDEETVSRKALRYLAEDYKLSFADGQWKYLFNIKQLASLGDFVESKGWVNEEYLQDKYAELEWKLTTYCERQYKHRLSEQTHHSPLKSLGYRFTPPTENDIVNAIKVAAVIEKGIDEGKV